MNDSRSVSKRVSFTLDEDRVIREHATEAGIAPATYIREQALRGEVKSVDWEMVRQHTEAIERIAFDIQVYTSDQNPNIWMFETDLKLIREELAKIRELEQRLIDLLTDAE